MFRASGIGGRSMHARLLARLFNTQSSGLSKPTLDVIRQTLPAVGAVGIDFTKHFYERMFKAQPELLNIFNTSNQGKESQPKALFSAVATSASMLLDRGELPVDLLEGIHQKHCALGVVPAQYDVVGEHLLGTIQDLMAPPKEVIDAWAELYGVLAKRCIDREEQLYQETCAKPGGWRGEREFIVKQKRNRSETVCEFTFVPKDGGPIPSFLSTQYITVWAKGEGWKYRQGRQYSLTNFSETGEYQIAVKKLGLMSGYLHDRVAEGDTILLSPPYGGFHTTHAVDRSLNPWVAETTTPIVLMSAGIGLTPTLSLLRQYHPIPERPIVWLHAAEAGHQHPLRHLLVGFGKEARPGFTRRVWYENPQSDDIRGDDNAALYHFDGRMNLDQVKDLLPLAHPDAMYFFCGPTPWMRGIAVKLQELGVQRKQLAFETFGPKEDILEYLIVTEAS